jgi:hypothetical protein
MTLKSKAEARVWTALCLVDEIPGGQFVLVNEAVNLFQPANIACLYSVYTQVEAALAAGQSSAKYHDVISCVAITEQDFADANRLHLAQPYP